MGWLVGTRTEPNKFPTVFRPKPVKKEPHSQDSLECAGRRRFRPFWLPVWQVAKRGDRKNVGTLGPLGTLEITKEFGAHDLRNSSGLRTDGQFGDPICSIGSGLGPEMIRRYNNAARAPEELP